MMKFRFLLWVIVGILRRTIAKKPGAARHAAVHDVRFTIRSRGGVGRWFRIADCKVTSGAGITEPTDFTLTFSSEATGFRILSAKDGKGAFLQGLHDCDLAVEGDFVKVMWFQRLTDFLQPDLN